LGAHVPTQNQSPVNSAYCSILFNAALERRLATVRRTSRQILDLPTVRSPNAQRKGCDFYLAIGRSPAPCSVKCAIRRDVLRWIGLGRPSRRPLSKRLPGRPADACGPSRATTSARSPSASKWTRKKFASWGPKAHCFARLSPSQAQKLRVLACPVLYRSGAPGVIRTHDLCLRRATLYPAELRALHSIQYPIGGPRATGGSHR
jgi:hypothetical protein